MMKSTNISNRNYGKPPTDLGYVSLVDDGEMMCYVYLPVQLPYFFARVPKRLKWTQGLLYRVGYDAVNLMGRRNFANRYVYLTVKRMFVENGAPGNRPGWHADGYGSDGDLNYIWYDMNPTEFAVMPFKDIPDDDFESMKEMERQISLDQQRYQDSMKSGYGSRPDPIVKYPDRHLLRLDEDVVHRVNPNPVSGIRTFIKVSVSEHQYNLRGNSHNYLFDYKWEMNDRDMLRRNCDNKDFTK